MWRIIAKIISREKLTKKEAKSFNQISQRTTLSKALQEICCITGRRGGKSKFAAALALYPACFKLGRPVNVDSLHFIAPSSTVILRTTYLRKGPARESDKMHITAKLISGFSAIGLAIALASLIAVVPISRGLNDVGEFHSPALYSIQSISAGVLEAVEESFAYVASGNKSEKDDFFERVKEFENRVEEFRKTALLEEPEERQERVLLETIIIKHKNLVKQAEVMFSEFEATDSISGKVFNGYENIVEDIIFDLEKFVEIEKEEVEQAHQRATQLIRTSQRSIYGLGMLSVLIAVVLGVFVSKQIGRPIRRLKEAALRIGEGQLDVEIEAESRDEIGQLTTAFNRMAGDLGRSRQKLQQAHTQLQALSRKLITVQETGQRRAALELHDGLGQDLALLSIEIERLMQKAPKSQSKGLLKLAMKTSELSSQVHNLSHQLHPSSLEHLGLVAASRSLCKEVSKASGIQIDFSYASVPSPISQDVSICLFRVLQESLTNIVKHSGVQAARVELAGSPDQLQLNVCDSGIGFDPESVGNDGGLGFVSMLERLSLVSGDLLIESRPSGGTQIKACVPLNSSAFPN